MMEGQRRERMVRAPEDERGSAAATEQSAALSSPEVRTPAWERTGALPPEPGTVEDDEIRARRARISAEGKGKKRMKKEAAGERRTKETPESKEARIRALAREFDQAAQEDEAQATEKYTQLRDSLPENEHELFRQAVRECGWDINGEVHSVGTEPLELIPLGKTAGELTEKLGEPEGKVDGIPYWLLADGDAVMLSGGPPESRYPERWGQGGFGKIKGSFYEYKEGVFLEIPETEAEHRRQEVKKASRENLNKKQQPEESGRESTREERTRSLEDAKTVFFRSLHREKKKAGDAFRQAAEGLSAPLRQKLRDFIAETTDIPRSILERIHSDVSHEHGRKTASKREDTSRRVENRPSESERPAKKESIEDRIEREIEEMFDK